jgi:hypothetical protein
MKVFLFFLLTTLLSCAGTKDTTPLELQEPNLKLSKRETISGMVRKNKAQGYFIYQNIDSRSLITVRLIGDDRELNQFLEKNVTVEGELTENSPFDKSLKVQRISIFP